MRNIDQPQFDPLETNSQPVDTKMNNPSQQTPEQVENEKAQNDPVAKFLKENGFDGNPNLVYSIDTISAKSKNGLRLPGEKKTFTNYAELQEYIKTNPEALATKEMYKDAGIVPFKIDYDQSVYDWSNKLSPEEQKKYDQIWDKLGQELMDSKNFEKSEQPESARVESSPEQKLNEIKQLENQALNSQSNPELSQFICSPAEYDTLIRTLGAEASQFENPTEVHMAELAQRELKSLSEQIQNGKSEGLQNADSILAKYLYRSISQNLSKLLNNLEVSIPWSEKEKILQVATLIDKIQKRQDPLKTRDLIRQQERFEELVGQYKKKQTPDEGKKNINGNEQTEATKTGQDAKEENRKEEERPSAGKQPGATTVNERPKSEKGEEMDSKTKFGTVLNNFIRQFQDGTLPGLFTDFIRSNPTQQQYEAAATGLMKLNGDYIKDRRLPSDKIEEYKDRIKDFSEKFNPDKLKFQYFLGMFEDEFGNPGGSENWFGTFKTLYGEGVKPTAEQWKDASKKIVDFMSEYRKDKRMKSKKSDEWREKLKTLSQDNFS